MGGRVEGPVDGKMEGEKERGGGEEGRRVKGDS